MTDMKNYTSKIATIVYANYTENVDMNNELFKQSELNALIKNDKDIIRVDYYINGVLIGTKMYTEKYAISQILKMNETQAKIEDKMEGEFGYNWFECKTRNEKRAEKINELNDKIKFYKIFVTEQGFDNSDIPYMFCCNWDDFKL